MKFQNAYSDPCRDSDLVCEDASLAQQHFKDDVDINVLLERFKVTGVMPQGIRVPQYGDFRGINDFRTAMEAVRAGEDAFMALPANLRARFGNDPQKYLEFCSNPDNLEEMRKLGLAPAAEKVAGEVSRGIGGVAPDGDSTSPSA